MKIDLSGLGRFVAEPKCNDAEIHSAVQQRHGRRMAKRVWFHLLCFQRRATQASSCDVFRHKALQRVGAYRTSAALAEAKEILTTLSRFFKNGKWKRLCLQGSVEESGA
jgi:hypothetical protein